MDAKWTSRDGRVAELASEQEGVFATWQLRELGFTRDMVRRRLQAGRLFRVFRSVYALVPQIGLRGQFMAAALSYGPNAVLSHRAAAAILELGPWPTGAIDVTVAVRRKPQPGVRLHRAEVERRVVDGFPVTTVARTLVDIAHVLPYGRLEEAFERGERLGILDAAEVEKMARGRRGARKIHRILAEFGEPAPTRSELERAFRRLCKVHGIPLPSHNVCVHGEDVDAYWPAEDVVVELDSFQFHKTRRAFERDRRKSAALERANCRVLRFTWRQIRQESDEVAATVHSALAQRRGERSAAI